MTLLRAGTHAGFEYKEPTDAVLDRRELWVCVPKVFGVPEVYACLVGDFDVEAQVPKDGLRVYLGLYLAFLAEVGWVKVEEIVVLDPGLRDATSLEIPNGLE